MLELGQIVAVCITPYSVKTSYKTSSVHVAKLITSSTSASLVQGSLPSAKLCYKRFKDTVSHILTCCCTVNEALTAIPIVLSSKLFRSLSPIQNDLRTNYQYKGTFSYPIRSIPWKPLSLYLICQFTHTHTHTHTRTHARTLLSIIYYLHKNVITYNSIRNIIKKSTANQIVLFR